MTDNIKTSLNDTYKSMVIDNLDNRLKKIEGNFSEKKSRLEPTTTQRFLIMYYTKALEHIIQNDLISQNTKDLQVATILNIHQDNARKYLSELSKKVKPLLHTKSNYEFLAGYFINPGQEDILKEVEKILNKILKQKDTL